VWGGGCFGLVSKHFYYLFFNTAGTDSGERFKNLKVQATAVIEMNETTTYQQKTCDGENNSTYPPSGNKHDVSHFLTS
jgi:hypothetical protein